MYQPREERECLRQELFFFASSNLQYRSTFRGYNRTVTMDPKADVEKEQRSDLFRAERNEHLSN